MKKLCALIIIASLLCGLAGCTGSVSPSENVTVSPSEIPMETNSEEQELQYTFDPYVLPPDATSYLGDDLQYYRILVDAVLEQETTVSLPEEALYKAVSCLISKFPLCALMSDFNIDTDNSCVTFTFTYDYEEHAELIRAFENRVEQAIRSSVLPSYNDCEKALVLYRWTAQNISYVDGDDVCVYHALMDGEGICQSYAGVYQYLLVQVGIDALEGSAFMDNDEAHEWTIVKLDGQWFHMDPTFEDSFDCGDGLEYFGMDDTCREQSGAVSPFTTGIGDWCTTSPVCESYCFYSFDSCVYWEFEADNHSILLYDDTGTEAYAAFDTNSFEVSYY